MTIQHPKWDKDYLNALLKDNSITHWHYTHLSQQMQNFSISKGDFLQTEVPLWENCIVVKIGRRKSDGSHRILVRNCHKNRSNQHTWIHSRYVKTAMNGSGNR